MESAGAFRVIGRHVSKLGARHGPRRGRSRLGLGVLLALAMGWVTGGCGGVQVDGLDPARWLTYKCPRDRVLTDDEARNFEKYALPAIWRVLADPEQKSCWPSAVRVAGYIGYPRVFKRLRTFIETVGTGPMDDDQFLAVRGSFVALGHLARKNLDESTTRRVVGYLIRSTDPAEWKQRRGLKWRIKTEQRRDIVRLLANAAVTALAVANDDEAQDQLVELALDSTERRVYSYSTSETREITTINELFTVHSLPVGRAVYALQEMVLLPTVRDSPDLGGLVEAILEMGRARYAARYAADNESDATRDASSRSLVRRSREVTEARLRGFHGQLESLTRLRDAREDLEAIKALRRVLYPNGLRAVIKLDDAEVVEFVANAIEVIRTAKGKETDRLGLREYVNVVATSSSALGEALKAYGQSGQDSEGEQDAAELQTGISAIIAKVISRYPGLSTGEDMTRAALLEPLLKQSDAVGDYLRRHRVVRDIDPTTGVELPALVGNHIIRPKRARASR